MIEPQPGLTEAEELQRLKQFWSDVDNTVFGYEIGGDLTQRCVIYLAVETARRPRSIGEVVTPGQPTVHLVAGPDGTRTGYLDLSPKFAACMTAATTPRPYASTGTDGSVTTVTPEPRTPEPPVDAYVARTSSDTDLSVLVALLRQNLARNLCKN
jgi:hypothetical protein